MIIRYYRCSLTSIVQKVGITSNEVEDGVVNYNSGKVDDATMTLRSSKLKIKGIDSFEFPNLQQSALFYFECHLSSRGGAIHTDESD